MGQWLYYLGFVSKQPADGRFHRIRIATSLGQSVTVHARRGYFATIGGRTRELARADLESTAAVVAQATKAREAGDVPALVENLQRKDLTAFEEAEALQNAIGAFKRGQPIGDGIGPMVVGRMMLGKEKKLAARETVYSEDEYRSRKLYLLKAEGPSGTVGRPGEAMMRLVGDLGIKVDAIIMIDAALKLEGEKTGEVAEGIGAAIGGIGVEKYQIEEVATKFDIPVYAVIVKQSVQDAITIMRKEIADAAEKVANTVYSVIEDKTAEGQSVIVVGVGNTLGVSQ